jgi:drug/metabolite transporter (DMT)-like permease
VYKGVLYLLAATFTFSLVNFGVKILSGPNWILPDAQVYPVHEMVFFRSVITLSICIAVIKMKGIPFFGHNKLWLIIRGITGATGLFLFFMTIQNLPLAVATTVQYLSPVFTIIIAIFLLKEKVKPIQWLFFAISLAGVFVIGYEPAEGEEIKFGWLILGVISAFFSGVAYNAIMKCRNTDAPITVVMYFPLIATPITLIWCIFGGFIIPQGGEWIVILCIGILTQIAQVCMTRAFNADSASTVAPLKYIGAIYASLMGFFFFDETLGMIAGLGISLIILGVLLNTWFKKRKSVAVV